MSTPICRGAFAGVWLAAALSGCMLTGDSADAPRHVSVTSDRVTIAGPAGYCADPVALRETEDTGFVLLGNCAAISGSRRAQQPAVPAVLTAAVSGASDGGTLTESLGDLDGFFRSDEGRALLSRSAEADTVEILATRVEDGMFLLHARDTSATSLSGVEPDYWRAYMDVGRRLVTLSVLALEDRGVSDADALATLIAFSAEVRAANPPGASPEEALAATSAPQPEGSGNRRPFTGGLFQRIFR